MPRLFSVSRNPGAAWKTSKAEMSIIFNVEHEDIGQQHELQVVLRGLFAVQYFGLEITWKILKYSVGNKIKDRQQLRLTSSPNLKDLHLKSEA